MNLANISYTGTMLLGKSMYAQLLRCVPLRPSFLNLHLPCYSMVYAICTYLLLRALHVYFPNVLTIRTTQQFRYIEQGRNKLCMKQKKHVDLKALNCPQHFQVSLFSLETESSKLRNLRREPQAKLTTGAGTRDALIPVRPSLCFC